MSRIPKPNVNSHVMDKMPELPKIFRSKPINLRRSKSACDLRQPLTTKNKAIPSSTLTRTAVKRPGQQLRDEPAAKPKIMKKVVKIPDWDYKTRFNNLNEKYTTLVKNHQENEKKLADGAQVLRENDILTAKLTELETEKAHFAEKINKLKDALNDQTLHLCMAQKSNQNLSEENERLIEKVECLETEKTAHLSQIAVLEATLNNKTFALAELENEYQIAFNRISSLQNEISCLKQQINKAEETRRVLHNVIQDLKGNIRVFCRVRPPLNDQEKSLQCNFNFENESSIEISKSRVGAMKNELQEFSFDRVFDQNSTQDNVFDELSHFIQSALDGYHVCVFAYGQTGSGKTYTMQGTDEPEKRGLIPKAIDFIFRKKEEMENMNWSFKIHASFLEIYNENVRDLLNIKNEKNLDIRYNDGKGTSVSNLTILPISSVEELLQSMLTSQKNRTTAITDFNHHSSRSHAVTKIYIEAHHGQEQTLEGSVSLVDLAGSESAKFTNSERLIETKNINKSLSCLGSVMLALHKKEQHIPYRNSKLTFLLQSSLGGNCKCLMIVNISPSEDCYSESINALRFASTVKEVKTHSISRNRIFKTPVYTSTPDSKSSK